MNQLIQSKLKKCPNWLRDKYREKVNYICQGCNLEEINVGKLQIHRIKRGNQNGTYEPKNVKVLCKSCHKKYHSLEIGVTR